MTSLLLLPFTVKNMCLLRVIFWTSLLFTSARAFDFRNPLPRLQRTAAVPRQYRRGDAPDAPEHPGSGLGTPILRLLTSHRSVHQILSNLAEVRPEQLEERIALKTPRDLIISSPSVLKRNKQVITDVEELRAKVLDENVPLKHLQVNLRVANVTAQELMHHDVVQLIAERYRTQSKPGSRIRDDTAVLALSMEGGGMRGAVSAGMAAAIAALGLTDSFDKIYGSSAGSVIGAYMVSRQMCLDVYVDILPASKKSFVCIKRMASAIAATAVDRALSYVHADLPKFGLKAVPGMNISFVLDGIMHDAHGIRPLDMKSFRANDKKQPLRIASSYSEDGTLKSKCFGSEHFFSDQAQAVRRADGAREGIYACLEASMTVPGATGAPVPILENNKTLAFFDAFCFEPLPYRSAVEEGATHVLVLASRPEGFQPKTAPGAYELAVAPMYFRSHGEPEVARFFEKGGQQYIYAEDLLTLEQGKMAGLQPGGSGIHVPPPKILHGVDRDAEAQRMASTRAGWKKAHILPLKVPLNTPELHTLEQDRTKVSDAVREGFAVAFDLFAPAIGLELDNALTGTEVAKLVFPPDTELDESVLEKQLRIYGDTISSTPTFLNSRRRKRDIVLRVFGLGRNRKKKHTIDIDVRTVQDSAMEHSPDEFATDTRNDSKMLMSLLPGFSGSNMTHLSTCLRQNV